MPIYEYQCKHCGIIERLEHVNATPQLVCSACHSKVTKLISVCAFTLDTDCPNHPDKVQKKSEERKLQLKKGTLEEWQGEHKKKFNRDRYGIGGHFSGGSGAAKSRPDMGRAVKKTGRRTTHK